MDIHETIISIHIFMSTHIDIHRHMYKCIDRHQQDLILNYYINNLILNSIIVDIPDKVMRNLERRLPSWPFKIHSLVSTGKRKVTKLVIFKSDGSQSEHKRHSTVINFYLL